MDWKRIGRLLVCLVLVVCMLVNISPIRARAVIPEYVIYEVAKNVITGVIVGLGIGLAEAYSDVFFDLVDDCHDYLKTNTAHITDEDKIFMWATGNPDLPYMVQQSLVEDIRSWLWDESGVVAGSGSYNSCYTNRSCSSWSEAIAYASNCPASYIGYSYDRQTRYIIVTNVSSYVSWSDNNLIINGSGTNHSVYYSGASCWEIRGSSMNYWYYDVTQLATSPIIEVDETFTSGFIAGSDVDYTTGYPDWSAGAASVPASDAGTDDDLPVVPIGVGQTQEETAGFTQEDIWAGKSTYVDTSTGTDTETGTGTGSGSTSVTVDMSGVITGLEDQTAQLGVWLGEVITGIQSIPQAIKQVLVDVFVPSEDYLSVKVDALLDKFPFIGGVIATGRYIRDSISADSGPPVIYVDLGLATSGNYGSQKVLLTDFAWYAKYKPTVDAVLSAALWTFFGWRVFLKLPGIISGESGVIGEIRSRKETYDKIQAGPPRGKK